MMKPARAALCGAACALVLAPCGFAADSNKVPAKLVHARYVALGFETSDEPFLSESDAAADPNRVLPEDLRTLSDLRKLIESWGRYTVTSRPGQAELFVAVRIGRRTSVGGGITFGSSDSTRSRTYQAGVDVSRADDMLTVYDAYNGRTGPILWRSRRPGGLSDSSPKLFEELKAAVEKAAAKTPAKTP